MTDNSKPMDEDELFVVLFILDQASAIPGDKPFIRKIGIHDIEYDSDKKRYSKCDTLSMIYNESNDTIIHFGSHKITWDPNINSKLLKFGINQIAYDNSGRMDKLGIHKFKYALGKITHYGIHKIEYDNAKQRVVRLGHNTILYSDDPIETDTGGGCGCILL